MLCNILRPISPAENGHLRQQLSAGTTSVLHVDHPAKSVFCSSAGRVWELEVKSREGTEASLAWNVPVWFGSVTDQMKQRCMLFTLVSAKNLAWDGSSGGVHTKQQSFCYRTLKLTMKLALILLRAGITWHIGNQQCHRSHVGQKFCPSLIL